MQFRAVFAREEMYPVKTPPLSLSLSLHLSFSRARDNIPLQFFALAGALEREGGELLRETRMNHALVAAVISRLFTFREDRRWTRDDCGRLETWPIETLRTRRANDS